MDVTLCKYASKPCTNTRSLKKDGSLHRFCAFHRSKANDAQRRWHGRRRSRREEVDSVSDGPSSGDDCEPPRRGVAPYDLTHSPRTKTRAVCRSIIASRDDAMWTAPAVPAEHMLSLSSPVKIDEGFDENDWLLLNAFFTESDILSVADARWLPFEMSGVMLFDEGLSLQL